jgi:NADH:ubiquinone oxidoreductase subunit C
MNAESLLRSLGLSPQRTENHIGIELRVVVSPGSIYSECEKLKRSDQIRFAGIVCEDSGHVFCLFYIFEIYLSDHTSTVLISTEIPKLSPVLSSIFKLWPSARADESEVAELFGVNFEGLERPAGSGLLPARWMGSPLIKDYSYPENYSGIEHRRPPLRKDHVRP